MTDLSEIPLEDLKAEVARRTLLEREARERRARERPCCRNCAYRVSGHTSYGMVRGRESWVCRKRPKKFKTYSSRGPKYNQAYFACTGFVKGCEMFVHKNSAEGAKIRMKLSPMAGRVD